MKTVRYLLLVCLVCAVAGPAVLSKDKDTEVDKKKVYYGDPDNFKNPAVICLNDVFEKIPEYQDAKKKSDDDPEYYILLEKANKKFQKALKKAATDNGYDLVGEKGSITVKNKTVPDITDKVIEALE
jgi:hypothetical protein